MLQAIERSAFHRGEYVGYGKGAVWRITRVKHAGVWRAVARIERCEDAPRHAPIEAVTLGELDKMLVTRP